MGGKIKQNDNSGIRSQCEVLPVWVRGELYHRALPVPETDHLSLEQTETATKAVMLQHEMKHSTTTLETNRLHVDWTLKCRVFTRKILTLFISL